MAARGRKTAAGAAPPDIQERSRKLTDEEKNELSDTIGQMLPATRKRSRKVSRPQWDRKLSVTNVTPEMASSSKYAIEEDVPDEWMQLQDVLEDCRHNFAATNNPENVEEWKYLRAADNMQSWEKIFGRRASLTVGEADKGEGESVWIPDPKEGFIAAELVERGEKQSKIRIKYNESMINTDLIQDPNPNVFDGCEDMAMLSYLNEASVLHNLRERFSHNLIHTYSGLFCITVNPWRWLPIYSPKIVLIYKGQTLNSMPPHVYAIADNVYNNMIEGQEDQSILITGESGAGKTENTKKMIQYFTIVAAQKYDVGGITLEEQICESNPVLEAFGNAKSAHNDNSSRFGKFIRLCFTPNGKVSKAMIESYLLEKSRIVSQAMNERSYHIFYQLLSNATPLALKELLHLDKSTNEYRYLAQGMTLIEGVDDSNEMEHTERAMYILNFTNDERLSMYKQVASVLLMGEMRFRNKSRNDEQAAIERLEEPQDMCELVGLNVQQFLSALLEPTVMVRGELVKQGKTVPQVNFSVAALAKAVYEKMFRWLVKRTNMTLGSRASKRGGAGNMWHFIGILDIAGFEIFTINSFEQLCINYTNEKLQYFFNHQMFVREQEEYRLEGLKWEMMDFALDLKPTIDLIELKMGLLSMLEEECIMPKGSDKTYVDKLMDQHLNKCAVFGKPKGGAKVDAHFSVAHYAGVVNYNVVGWIDKNKDPLNASVVELLKASENILVNEIWNYYGTSGFGTGQEGGAPAPIPGVQQAPGQRAPAAPRGRKGSLAFMTVSSIFKEQLMNLVAILNSTHPHFVRCVVPNYERKPGVLNGPLVLNQLRCNGVLEGLRIVARGFPNRLIYEEFRDRFRILATEMADWEQDATTASVRICEEVRLRPEKDYDLGQTKLFFRVGVLGRLELMRTAKLNKTITQFQAWIRSYNVRYKWKLQEKHAEYTLLIQRNVRCWIKLREWSWFQLMLLMSRSVHSSVTLLKDKLKFLQEERDELKNKLEEALKEQEKLKKQHTVQNTKELDDLRAELEEERKLRKKAEASEVATKQDMVNVQVKLDQKMVENKMKDDEIERLKERLKKMQEEMDEKLKKPLTRDRNCMTDDVIIFKDIDELLDIDTLNKMGILQQMLEMMGEALGGGVSGKGFTNRKGKKFAKNIKGIGGFGEGGGGGGGSLLDMLRQQQEEAVEEEKKIQEVEKKKKEEEEIKAMQPLTDEERRRLLEKDIGKMSSQELKQVARDFQDVMKKKEETITDLENMLRNQKKVQEDKERVMAQLKDDLGDLEAKLRKMQEQLAAEAEANRMRKMNMDKLQRTLEEVSKQKSVKEKHMSSLVEELQKQIEDMNKMILEKNDQIRETRDNYDKLMSLIIQLQRQVESLESSLMREKSERRRIERCLNDLRGDYEELSDKIKRLLRRLEEQTKTIDAQQAEIKKLNGELSEAALLKDEAIKDLKERHSLLVDQLHEKIEHLHRKALKLETDNKQMKAQIYNDTEPIEAKRIARSSSNLLVKAAERTERSSGDSSPAARRTAGRQFSFGVDTIARQLEDLEREKQELYQDKRLMRKEIDACAELLEKESQERENVNKQLRSAQQDISRMKRRISAETEEKNKLAKDIRTLRAELILQEQRTTKMLIEKGVEVEGERMRAVLKMTGATSESQEAQSKASGLERVCGQLHGEVEEYRRGLRDAHHTIQEMEEKIRSSRGSSLLESGGSDPPQGEETRYED